MNVELQLHWYLKKQQGKSGYWLVDQTYPFGKLGDSTWYSLRLIFLVLYGGGHKIIVVEVVFMAFFSVFKMHLHLSTRNDFGKIQIFLALTFEMHFGTSQIGIQDRRYESGTIRVQFLGGLSSSLSFWDCSLFVFCLSPLHSVSWCADPCAIWVCTGGGGVEQFDYIVGNISLH